MKAVQFSGYGSADVVRIGEVEAPHAGPGQVRIQVRASGISIGDVRIRSGALRDAVPIAFPYRSGFDAAGVVDEIGAGVVDAQIGDEVFGWVDSASRGANAELAVLVEWAAKPTSWTWAEAGGAAGAVETATRVLDYLAADTGQTVLVQGATGGVGSVIVQMAVAQRLNVIGTGREDNHALLRSWGATPTTYGEGLAERVRILAPGGIDGVIDCAGGALPDLVAIAGDPTHVVTIADVEAARHGVHLSRGTPDSLAVHGLGLAVALANDGRLHIPVAASLPFTEAAAAHRLTEGRHPAGKVVLENHDHGAARK